MKKWVFVVMSAGLFALPAMAQVDSLTAPATVDTTVVAPPPAVTAPIQTSTPPDAIEVARALETRRQNALVAADTKTLAETFAADATYVHANGLMQTPGELFSMLERGEMRYVRFVLEDVKYRAYGETVVVTGVQRIDVKSAGKAATLRSRYTTVYSVGAAGAKMVAYQSTPTPTMTTR